MFVYVTYRGHAKTPQWVVVDKNKKIIIISRYKEIALSYARWRNNRDRV